MPKGASATPTRVNTPLVASLHVTEPFVVALSDRLKDEEMWTKHYEVFSKQQQ